MWARYWFYLCYPVRAGIDNMSIQEKAFQEQYKFPIHLNILTCLDMTTCEALRSDFSDCQPALGLFWSSSSSGDAVTDESFRENSWLSQPCANAWSQEQGGFISGVRAQVDVPEILSHLN